MRLLRSLLAAPIVCAVLLSAGIYTLPIPAKAEQWIGRSVTLGGRKVQCHNAQIMIDRTLPSEGGAGDDFVILNPDMLNNQPETVRIFVFKHECGHLTVGDSELKADCFAVQQGVHEHWLDRKGLDQVCQSFDGAPETSTHPSAERRCRNLDQCYAAALAVEAKANPPTGTSAPAPVAAKKPVVANKALAPQTAAAKPVPAIAQPAFKTTVAKAPAAKAPAAQPSVAETPAAEAPAVTATGSTPNAAIPPAEAWGVPVNDETAAAAHKAVSAWRCTDPLRVSDAGSDGIAHLIGEDAKTAAGCR
jgi:hypothetical protein